MVDTILAYTVDDFRDHAAHELFGEFDYDGRSADEQSEADRFVKDGLMQWYNPPILPGETSPHQWSCKEDTGTLYAWPSIEVDADVTVDGVHAAGSTTITASEATFYETMVGRSIVVTGVGTFTITAYQSSTIIVVSGNATCTDKTFSIASDGTYDLPANVASLVWKQFQFDSDVTRRKVVEVSSHMVNSYRNHEPSFGPPRFYYPTFKAAGYTSQHRKKVVMWPTPDAVYPLTYRFKVIPYAPDDDHLYPLGGPEFSKSQMASVLAVIETRKLDGHRGPRWDEFMIALAADVADDRNNNAPPTLGMMPDGDGYEMTEPLNLVQSGTIYVNA